MTVAHKHFKGVRNWLKACCSVSIKGELHIFAPYMRTLVTYVWYKVFQVPVEGKGHVTSWIIIRQRFHIGQGSAASWIIMRQHWHRQAYTVYIMCCLLGVHFKYSTQERPEMKESPIWSIFLCRLQPLANLQRYWGYICGRPVRGLKAIMDCVVDIIVWMTWSPGHLRRTGSVGARAEHSLQTQFVTQAVMPCVTRWQRWEKRQRQLSRPIRDRLYKRLVIIQHQCKLESNEIKINAVLMSSITFHSVLESEADSHQCLSDFYSC